MSESTLMFVGVHYYLQAVPHASKRTCTAVVYRAPSHMRRCAAIIYKQSDLVCTLRWHSISPGARIKKVPDWSGGEVLVCRPSFSRCSCAMCVGILCTCV